MTTLNNLYLMELSVSYAQQDPTPPPSSSTNAFYVSTNGDDAWTGRLKEPNGLGDGPFKTLARARDAMRTNSSISVTFVRAGTYYLPETLTFDSSDNGNTFFAYPNETVSISGGQLLGNWNFEQTTIYSTPLATPTGLDLFVGEERWTCATKKPYDPANPFTSTWHHIPTSAPSTSPQRRTVYFQAADNLTANDFETGVQVQIFHQYDRQSDAITTVSSVDFTNNIITLAGDAVGNVLSYGTFRLLNNDNWLSAARTGEFAWRASTNRLVVSAADETFVNQTVIPRLTNLITMNGASNVTFRGFRFLHNAYNNTAIILTGCSNCNFISNVFRCVGRALRFDATNNCVVENCEFTRIGFQGVDMSNQSSGNVFKGNKFTKIGQVRKGGHAWGGNGIHNNVFEYNEIDGASRYGVSIKDWNANNANTGNIIRYNVINATMQETADGGAIEMLGRSQTPTNTQIYGNYIKNCRGLGAGTGTLGTWVSPFKAFAVYLDDMTDSVTIKENIFIDTGLAAVYIHAGDNNVVTNNFSILSDNTGEFIRIEHNPPSGTPQGIPNNNTVIKNVVAKSPFSTVSGDLLDYWDLLTAGTFVLGENLVYQINPYSTSTSTTISPVETWPRYTGTITSNLYVSTTGSDTNAGTQAAPFRTIQRACNAATAGTRINVAPGTYAESIVVPSTINGTSTNPIILFSETRGGAKIVPPANSTSDCAIQVNANNWKIHGFEIDGTNHVSGTLWRWGIYMDGSGCITGYNYVHHILHTTAKFNSIPAGSGGGGIYHDAFRSIGSTNQWSVGNLIWTCGPQNTLQSLVHGLYWGTTGTIVNNIIWDCSGAAIHLYHDARQTTIIHNTIYNSRIGMLIGTGSRYNFTGTASGNVVRNNIVYDCDAYGTDAYGIYEWQDSAGQLGANTYSHNAVMQCNIPWALLNGNTHSNDINGTDPGFVDYRPLGGGNSRLLSTSVCRNVGTNATTHATDLGGYARPQETTVDLGAYEYIPNATVTTTTDTVADPLFTNPSAEDYSLQGASPAFGLGIKDLEWDKMGNQGYTAPLPIPPEETPPPSTPTLTGEIVRAATEAYTHPSAPGPYPGRLLDSIAFRREIAQGANNYGAAQMSWGEASLINSDGKYSYLIANDVATDGRVAYIRVGRDTLQAYSEFPVLYTGQVEQIWISDDIVYMRWRDRFAEIIDAPIQTSPRYLGNNVAPNGVEGDENLLGQPKPVLYGYANNLQPVLVNTSKVIYQVADKAVTVTAVRDGGIPLTVGATRSTLQLLMDTNPAVSAWDVYSGSEGTFIRLQAAPNRMVTCDANEGSSGQRTAGAIFKRVLLERAGVGTTDFDEAAITALNSIQSAEISGLWFGTTEVNIKDALNRLVTTIGGWYGLTNAGKWTINRIEAPTGLSTMRFQPYDVTTAAVAATDSDLLDFNWQEDASDQHGVPVLRVKLSYDPNLTVMADSDLGGDKSSPTDPVRSPGSSTAGLQNREWLKNAFRFVVSDNSGEGAWLKANKHPTAKEWAMETFFRLKTAAEAEALRQFNMRKTIPRVAVLRVPLNQKTATLDLGNIVEIKYPPAGLPEFKKFLITGLDYNGGDNVITLTVRR